MKLSDAQFGTLSTLDQYGPMAAVEVLMPPAMNGKRKVKLEWHVANAKTLANLEVAGLVSVKRATSERYADATGRLGHPRRAIYIYITDAGRAALAGER